MTKFHVDLGATRIEEPQPTHQFEEFKSLKKAVRWARAEHTEGTFGHLPEILDDDGNPITIDWDSPEWLTRDELTLRLEQAETSSSRHRQRAEKLRAEQDMRDREIIEAGFIPIRVLVPHLTVMSADHHGPSSAFYGAPEDFPAFISTEYTIKLQSNGIDSPFAAAMQALAERLRK